MPTIEENKPVLRSSCQCVSNFWKGTPFYSAILLEELYAVEINHIVHCTCGETLHTFSILNKTYIFSRLRLHINLVLILQLSFWSNKHNILFYAFIWKDAYRNFGMKIYSYKIKFKCYDTVLYCPPKLMYWENDWITGVFYS